MLPYRYRADDELGSLMSEAGSPAFGMVEGFRPIVLIDSSAAVGESLVYIRAALKRILYSFMVAKSKFNFVKFTAQGRPVMWESSMVAPTAHKLREAEEWLDAVKPLCSSPDILQGLLMALTPLEVDAVYVLSAGFPRRADVEYILGTVRSKNIRDVPVHVIGIECEPGAELDLHRLAEENRGSFRHKRFDGLAAVAGQRQVLGQSIGASHDARLTIG